jgi:hypothetical protein
VLARYKDGKASLGDFSEIARLRGCLTRCG